MISHDLFTMGIPIAEKVIRTIAVYGGVAILIRLAGKRDLAQLNTFDLVVVLLLSNVVQNAVIGNDNSLVGGMIGASVLVAINSVVVRTANLSDRAIAVFEGTSTVLARDGRYDDRALRHEGLRQADLDTALRVQGAAGVEDVKRAVLGPGGSVVVDLEPDERPATKRDVDALLAAVKQLESRITPT
jgi:uncharacterized membrane protein YcaP (DUF421 family)